MENNETNSNWQAPNNASGMGMGQDLEGANLSMVLGIIGLCLSFLCCGPIGFVFSIIAWVKGKKAVAAYEGNPTAYSEKSFNQAKSGKIMGLIGLILGIVMIGFLIIAFAMGMVSEMLKN